MKQKYKILIVAIAYILIFAIVCLSAFLYANSFKASKLDKYTETDNSVTLYNYLPVEIGYGEVVTSFKQEAVLNLKNEDFSTYDLENINVQPLQYVTPETVLGTKNDLDIQCDVYGFVTSVDYGSIAVLNYQSVQIGCSSKNNFPLEVGNIIDASSQGLNIKLILSNKSYDIYNGTYSYQFNLAENQNFKDVTLYDKQVFTFITSQTTINDTLRVEKSVLDLLTFDRNKQARVIVKDKNDKFAYCNIFLVSEGDEFIAIKSTGTDTDLIGCYICIRL